MFFPFPLEPGNIPPAYYRLNICVSPTYTVKWINVPCKPWLTRLLPSLVSNQSKNRGNGKPSDSATLWSPHGGIIVVVIIIIIPYLFSSIECRGKLCHCACNVFLVACQWQSPISLFLQNHFFFVDFICHRIVTWKVVQEVYLQL